MKILDQALEDLRRGNAVALQLARVASDRGEKLTATEFAILCCLSGGQEHTVRGLEAAVGVSQSTISIALKKLSKAGGTGREWVVAAGSIPGDKRTMRYKLNTVRQKELRSLMRSVAGSLNSESPSPAVEAALEEGVGTEVTVGSEVGCASAESPEGGSRRPGAIRKPGAAKPRRLPISNEELAERASGQEPESTLEADPLTAQPQVAEPGAPSAAAEDQQLSLFT